MPRERSDQLRLRHVLSGALLCGLAAIAASCAEALDLDGRRDAFAETCAIVDRCFGDRYDACEARAALVSDLHLSDFLTTAPACVQGCDTIHRCLDFDAMCHGLEGACDVDADCCGFTAGQAVCSDGSCCRPLGAACASEGDCCAGQGPCDGGRCGGVVCAAPGVVCLNDFQCCTGKCGDTSGQLRCADSPCPPVGFECEVDADCCDRLCVDGRCAEPPDCALLGETCSDGLPCCNAAHTCSGAAQAGVGVCSDQPNGCFPDNSDCFSDVQCCSGHCLGDFKRCGLCVESEGGVCSVASPCCAPMTCTGFAEDGTTFCETPSP